MEPRLKIGSDFWPTTVYHDPPVW